MLKNIFFSLFTHISIGLIFTVLFMSIEEIGKLYFRVTTIIALTLIVVALITQPFGRINLFQIIGIHETKLSFMERFSYLLLLLSTFFLVIYNLTYPRFHKLVLFLVFLFGIFAIAYNSLVFTQSASYTSLEKALFVFNGIGSALILGSVLGAMITGHWYLVKHKLSLNPLKSSSKIYIFSVVFRILLLILTFIAFWWMGKTSVIRNMVSGLTPDSIFFMGRVAIGLIIPLIFGFMILESVKIRSTQSATGILYATIIMVLIGEAFAKFLSHVIGIPL